MLKIALLILTINANGDIRATVSPAEGADDCQQSLETVRGVLTGAGARIVAMSCGLTSDRLTPFDHGLGVKDEIHRYRVTLHPDRFSVVPIKDGSCARQTMGAVETYCTVSSQRLLGE